MKIKVSYEDRNHPTVIEVPDGDCEIWIEDDYQRRLADAEDKSAVKRRTAQEIMDEEYNKPTFNIHHKETRRHVSLDELDDQHISDGADVLADLIDREISEELYTAISELKPKQRDLVKKVFWENIRQAEIAKTEGVSEAAIAQRMAVIYKRLKKILSEEKNFLEKP